jgi:hypothetical protein
MPDPHMSDEDVASLARAYLTQRRGQSVPRNLDANAVSFALTRRRTKGAGAILGTAGLVIAGALTAGVVLAFHHQAQPGPAPGAAARAQVRIVRVAGSLALPPLDRTIRNVTVITALADDIKSLPLFPTDERCPSDFGTYYSLTFTLAGVPPWTATVDAEGCEIVQIPGQPARWAGRTPQLWSELTDALGIDPRNLPPWPPVGTVRGTLQEVGGAKPGTPRPLPGSVALRNSEGSMFTATAGLNGAFSVGLPPGSYTLIGHSPSFGGGEAECDGLAPVTVIPSATVTAVVDCVEF